MSSQISESVLSAYLDNELPAGERAQVERWLESTPDARRNLDALRRMRGWLRDLPRAELPDAFAAEVMHQAERQMLLPVHEAAPSGRGAKRWLLPLAVTAAAASVAVMLGIQLQTAQRGAGVVMRSAVESSAADASLASDSGLDAESQVLVDAIAAVADEGHVPVVRLYVMDGEGDHLQFVQWVLAESHINGDAAAEPPAGAGARRAEKRADAARSSTDGIVRRQGVLVVASTDQLVESVGKLLQSKGRVIGWQVGTPIDVTQLDEPLRQAARLNQLPPDLSEDRAPLIARREIAGQLEKDANLPADAPAVARTAAPATAQALSREADKETAGTTSSAALGSTVAPPVQAKQYVINVPDSQAEISQAPANVPQESGSKMAAAAPLQNLSQSAFGQAPRPRSPLVRVIFLVEPHEPRDVRPAPPAKPSSGDGAAWQRDALGSFGRDA